jgi:hypothetical protein
MGEMVSGEMVSGKVVDEETCAIPNLTIWPPTISPIVCGKVANEAPRTDPNLTISPLTRYSGLSRPSRGGGSAWLATGNDP